MNRYLSIALVLAACAASYLLGTLKHAKAYEDACHMSDLIRCYEDHLQEDSINDLGCFEELEGIFLWDDCISETPVNLSNYAYCY
jgi:hypothetical protein